MNEAEIAFGGLVVAGSEASGAFEFVEAALDAVAERIDKGVDWDGLPAIGPASNSNHAALRLSGVRQIKPKAAAPSHLPCLGFPPQFLCQLYNIRPQLIMALPPITLARGFTLALAGRCQLRNS